MRSHTCAVMEAVPFERVICHAGQAGHRPMMCDTLTASRTLCVKLALTPVTPHVRSMCVCKTRYSRTREMNAELGCGVAVGLGDARSMRTRPRAKANGKAVYLNLCVWRACREVWLPVWGEGGRGSSSTSRWGRVRRLRSEWLRQWHSTAGKSCSCKSARRAGLGGCQELAVHSAHSRAQQQRSDPAHERRHVL